MRIDPSSAAESTGLSSSADIDSILREIEKYVVDLREDADNVDTMVKGNEDEDVIIVSQAANPLADIARHTSGIVHGFSTSVAGVPLVTMSGDPSRPIFIADLKALKTHNRDILSAYKDGRIDGRWFKYLLLTFCEGWNSLYLFILL